VNSTMCNTGALSGLEGEALLLRGRSWGQCVPTFLLVSVQVTLTFTDSKGDDERDNEELFLRASYANVLVINTHSYTGERCQRIVPCNATSNVFCRVRCDDVMVMLEPNGSEGEASAPH
jgi:hypothetical protein